jgi:hypothetical protein
MKKIRNIGFTNNEVVIIENFLNKIFMNKPIKISHEKQ